MPKPNKPAPAARPGKPPQTIRGGFIVVRRQERTGRLLTRHGTAYEHGSAAEAATEAAALAQRFGCEFAVFGEVPRALPPPKVEPVADPGTGPETDPVALAVSTREELPAPADKRPLVVERRKARASRPSPGPQAR